MSINSLYSINTDLPLRVPTCNIFVFIVLAMFSFEPHAAVIEFNGELGIINEDAGAAVYSGVAIGTTFSGSVDDTTINGSITDGVTPTEFGCCISADGLGVGNNGLLDASDAATLNTLLGFSMFSDGDLIDNINIEGDSITANGGRIEVGLSYVFDSTTFTDSDITNYPFEPNVPLITLFFIVEENAAGELIYSAHGLVTSTAIAQSQTITQIIDASGDGSGNSLDFSANIRADAEGNIYVTGRDSDNAFRITPEGQITEIIDALGDGVGNTLDTPRGLAVDSMGDVYVAGNDSNNVFKITPSGSIVKIVDSSGDGLGHVVEEIANIAVDAAGNVYLVAEETVNALKITPGGSITEIINATGDGSGNVYDASDTTAGVAVDSSGNVYVTGGDSDNVFKITPSGSITEIIDATGDGSGNILDEPTGIAVDTAGNVYVTGVGSNNAFKITTSGEIAEIIDADGDGGGTTLTAPFGIAVDTPGNVYVAGLSSNNAFKITTSGSITEIINATGDGGGNTLDGAVDIAVDAAGNVYVTGAFSDNAFRITPAKGTENETTEGTMYLMTTSASINDTTLHIVNSSDVSQSFTGTLYNPDGERLGSADTALSTSATVAKGRLILSSDDVETLFGVAPWSGPAMLEVTGTDSFELMAKLISPSGLISNTNCVRENRVLNIDGFNSDNLTFVRFINTTDSAMGELRGTLFDANGTAIGTSNVKLLNSLAAKQAVWITRTEFASLVGTEWNGEAMLEVDNVPGLKLLNLNLVNNETFFNFSCFESSASGRVFIQTTSTSNNVSFTHLVNTSNSALMFSGTLYNGDGVQLGAANQPLHTSMVPAKGRVILSSEEIESAFSASPWSGPAIVEVTASDSFEVMTKLTSPSGLISNTNCVRSNQVHNVEPPGSSDQTFVRLINTGTGTLTDIKGTLYDGSGNVIGSANQTLELSLPAKSAVWLTRDNISDIVGDTWTGAALLEVNSPPDDLRLLNLNLINSETFFNFSCYESSN